ncbi:MAG: putative toxin-antitoxin system toxin component, PIN family [Hyphomicrobiaceae bacterium]
MKADRIVCDTNVLISAAIMPEGKARAVVNYVVAGRRFLLSRETFDELVTRLDRPKFNRYVTVEDRRDFLQLIMWISEFVTITGTPQGVRDPNDDKVLETAMAGNADCLVTGDGDLLTLRPIGESENAASVEDALFKGVAILRPAEFLKLARPEN